MEKELRKIILTEDKNNCPLLCEILEYNGEVLSNSDIVSESTTLSKLYTIQYLRSNKASYQDKKLVLNNNDNIKFPIILNNMNLKEVQKSIDLDGISINDYPLQNKFASMLRIIENDLVGVMEMNDILYDTFTQNGHYKEFIQINNYLSKFLEDDNYDLDYIQYRIELLSNTLKSYK